MRYERVEECAECKGEKVRINREFKPYECPTCVGEGETYTPVEHTEKWAVYKDKSLKMTGGTEDQAWALFAQFSFDTDIEDDEAIAKSIRWSKKFGYTCEQIDVIRKEPNEE